MCIRQIELRTKLDLNMCILITHVLDDNYMHLQMLYLPAANEVWGKVIFSQVSVSLFTGGGMHAGRRCACPEGCACPGDMHARGACVVGGMCAWWEDVWLGACMVGGCVAGEMVTAAGGTHPTGMHSCFQTMWEQNSSRSNPESNHISLFCNPVS